jgi:putative transposase
MRYTSDLTETQWEKIRPLFIEAKYRSIDTKKEFVNAVLYLVKTGCQWRNLPSDFPKWKSVYTFFRRAKMTGFWDRILRYLVSETRVASGRNENPSYGLIDSQSVKTCYASDERGYDGGKKRKDANDIS